MRALILAAGYAVRLQPLTLKTPKPLLKVGGKSILDRVIDKLSELGRDVESACIVTNEKAIKKFEAWLAGRKAPFDIVLINDGTTSNENRLGAIRDLKFALDAGGIDGDVLVVAGDNLFEFSLKKFIEFAASRPGKVVVALRDIGDVESARKYGVAAIDREGRIVGFEEKPDKPKSSLISTGVYYFPKDKIGLVGEYIRSSDRLDAPGHYIKWLSDKGEAYGFVFDEMWYDIGDIGSLEEANRRYGPGG